MTASTLTTPARPPRDGKTLLRRAGIGWFLVAALGQAAFIWMILAHYGGAVVAGNPAAWNDKPLIKGHVAGDDAGNVMFAVHVLLAAVVTFGGLLQLVPQIRQRWPVLHRWNGRLFFSIAVVMSLGGLWLTWVRPTYLSLISAVSVSLNGVLILICAGVAWRMAATRRFEPHRRWAMRAFLVVNGVWFLRVAIMAWVLATGGGWGMDRTLSGPADIALQFGSYLIPLAVLELYLRAQRSDSVRTRRLTAGLVIAMTAVTALGVGGAIAFMWGPFML